MTITNLIKLLTCIILFVSCSAQQQKKSYSDCKKFNIEADTYYNGQNKSTIYSMVDFNSSTTKSLDIVRILNDYGYETIESFKRIYIENQTAFIFHDNILKQLSNNDLNKINEVFSDLDNNTTMINCEVNSSRKYIYRYFVRRNGKLIMSFYSNNLIMNIDKDLIMKDFKYLDLFENIK